MRVRQISEVPNFSTETWNSLLTFAHAQNERQSVYQTGQTAGVKMVGNQNKPPTRHWL